MKLFPFLAAAGLLVWSSVAGADALGLRAGIAYWQMDYDGELRSGGDFIDLDEGFGLDDEDIVEGWLRFEHPVPLLPNIGLAYAKLDDGGQGVVDTEFQGIEFSGAVASDIDLDLLDVVLYYEILDNVVSLDVGLAARFVDGEVSLTDLDFTGESATADVDDPVPSLYVAGRVNVPGTGWFVRGQAQGLAWDGDNAVDLRVGGGYAVSFVEVEAGYRRFNVDADDLGDLDVDVTFDGFFAGANLRF